MNGFIKIRVMSNGRYADCWQYVEDGVVKGHVNDNKEMVALPEVYESVTLTGQLHFAPNVLNDPNAVQPQALLSDEPVPEGFTVIAPFGPGIGPAPQPKAAEGA